MSSNEVLEQVRGVLAEVLGADEADVAAEAGDDLRSAAEEGAHIVGDIDQVDDAVGSDAVAWEVSGLVFANDSAISWACS